MSHTTTKWWHDDMSKRAGQLSAGVLNEMRKRILTSNIQREKLQLNEDTPRMRDFFEREIARYTKRKQHVQAQKQDHSELIRKLVQANISLARKCTKNNIPIAKTSISEGIYSWS
jgi:hypothetical protein